MLEHRKKVKARIKFLYVSGEALTDRCIGRALWIGYEHEGLHLETFLYMSILGPNIKPPSGVPRPDFAMTVAKAISRRVENQWFRIPTQEFIIGHEDPESDEGLDRFFAWDSQREPYHVTVPTFEAQGRRVSVGEYAAYLVDPGLEGTIPVTWVVATSEVTAEVMQQLAVFFGFRARGTGCSRTTQHQYFYSSAGVALPGLLSW
ncbi:hypothetical protein B0H63DRAFT_520389 [Podospora didyma]|uniref:Uncharacterized protein n=1 Tax=Podospora didyma TaxID=330526 RepID=A0AAE0U5C1_9PEZI|nr:hypothetical protein B0H63DRAFT_520389 [Podospora didyma]